MNGRGWFRAAVTALAAAVLAGCALVDRIFPAHPSAEPTPPTPSAPREIPCPRPESAALEGWVLLTVRVRADGTVESAKVLRAHPRGRFEDEALERVSRSHFHPKIVDGRAVAQEGMQCVEFERESI